ncbi:hypothetical protein EDD36DRAFT_246087 [Exophiala viscosa]|uniref:Uncharacterized protein n=1 Tax=Exophiala viscosa TaxID=2486360 RepID=A0AAN6DX08_9EURO|nr:hypothetical protein EDD36DRAFT_246087 [Exophiala viscosa]
MIARYGVLIAIDLWQGCFSYSCRRFQSEPAAAYRASGMPAVCLRFTSEYVPKACRRDAGSHHLNIATRDKDRGARRPPHKRRMQA